MGLSPGFFFSGELVRALPTPGAPADCDAQNARGPGALPEGGHEEIRAPDYGRLEGGAHARARDEPESPPSRLAGEYREEVKHTGS